jgi:hypothetical protein
MNIDPVLYNLIWGIGIMSAVLAAGISALFQLVNGWRERLSADRRHLSDLALKAAIVQWEHDIARTDKANASLRLGEKPKQLNEIDFDMILVRKLKLIETFGRGSIEKDIEHGFREMGRVSVAIRKLREKNMQALRAAAKAEKAEEEKT